MWTYFRHWMVFFVLQILVMAHNAEGLSIDEMIQQADNAASVGPTDVLHSDSGNFIKMQMDILVSPDEYEILKEESPDSGNVNTTHSRKKRTAAIKTSRYAHRWPNAKVNYEIYTSHFKQKQVGAILDAIKAWEKHTCLKFSKSTTAKNRIMFRKGQGGCYSSIGMGNRPQEIGLSSLCPHTPIVIHEIGHALGMWHEQSRPDRDNYITINTHNILSSELSQFWRLSPEINVDLGLPYDFKSIMHYSKKSFSVDGRSLTITTKDPRYQDVIGSIPYLSFLDVKTMNLLYNCKSHSPGCTLKDSQCPDNGFVSKDCICLCEGPGNFQPTKKCTGSVKPNPTKPSQIICEDKNDKCAQWASAGECDKNKAWMHPNCVMSCGLCKTGSCKDKYVKKCKGWASKGECQKYSAWMKKTCPKTCGVCSSTATKVVTKTPIVNCIDKHTSCKAWAAIGECDKNPSWMKVNCLKSCGVCYGAASMITAPTTTTHRPQPTRECEDKHTACKKWRQAGYCTGSFEKFVQSLCRLSCGLC